MANLRCNFGPSGVRCCGTKCPLYLVLFSFLLLCHILFSQRGLSQGYEILQGVLSHKKIRFWVKICFGTPPRPLGGPFQCFSSRACEKPTRTCAWGFHEHTTIATELIKLENTHLPSPHQTRAPKKYRQCRWGAERRVKRAQTHKQGPPSALAVFCWGTCLMGGG